MSREYVLKNYIDTVRKNYDYVLIDYMPSLGMMTINALVVAAKLSVHKRLEPVASFHFQSEALNQT